jgi:bacteriorhodopsin
VRYNTFRTLARVFVVLAWIVGILVFILSLVTGIIGGGIAVVLGIVIGIVGGFLSFASLYAFAQFIYVAIDIERNTRATVRTLLEEVEPEEEMEGVIESEG